MAKVCWAFCPADKAKVGTVEEIDDLLARQLSREGRVRIVSEDEYAQALAAQQAAAAEQVEIAEAGAAEPVRTVPAAPADVVEEPPTEETTAGEPRRGGRRGGGAE